MSIPTLISKRLSELEALLPYGLVRQCYTSNGEQFLNVTETQCEAKVQPDIVTDDFGGIAMAMVV